MHIGSKNKDNPNTYYMSSRDRRVNLEAVSMEKDLGVNIDSDLKFSQHVNIQVEKANKLLALIRRGFSVLDSVSLPVLYKSIVHPHLEYGNVVWHPRLKGDEEQLEKVQRRATKLMPEFHHLQYAECLKQLDLPSLYKLFRRARGDMIECFKYLRSIYNVSNDLLPRDLHSCTRGHSFKLKKPSVKTSVRQNFFSVRIVNAWNSLPESVVSAPTLNTFKNRLDMTWANYKFSQDFSWYHALKPARTNSSVIEREANQEETTNNDSIDRLIGE